MASSTFGANFSGLFCTGWIMVCAMRNSPFRLARARSTSTSPSTRPR